MPALPIADSIGWATAALGSLIVAPGRHNLLLFVCFWAIFPLAALIGRLRGEQVTAPPGNPLSRLLNDARIMVLATWATTCPYGHSRPPCFR